MSYLNKPRTENYMELKMTIQGLKKKTRRIILEDTGITDKVEKLWDFFIDNIDIIKGLKE